MINDGLTLANVDFFFAIFENINHYYRLNTVQMANLANMTRESARVHAGALEEKGYLARMGYRGWRLNQPLLQDQDLVQAVQRLTA